MITPEERDATISLAGDIARAVFEAAAPEILKIVAAAKPGTRLSQVGSMCVVEPVSPEELQQFKDLAPGVLQAYEGSDHHDYRKDLWVQVYVTYIKADMGRTEAEIASNHAVERFDKAFPQ